MSTSDKTILEQLDDGDFEAVAKVMAEFYKLHPEYGHDSRAPYTKFDGDATVYNSFVNGDGEASRYSYDVHGCSSADGWKQYDTRQDAHYFGCWYNMERRVTCTYCEGDETVVVCRTEAAWKAELAQMAECYGDPPPAFIGIDLDGTVTHYIDEDARPEVA